MQPADWPHLFAPGSGPVLLMLHGTGSNEHEIARLAAALDPSAAVLAPRGQVSENGANRWFRRLSEGVFDVADVAARADSLAGFLRWAIDHYGLESRRLIAVGFSNGANIALALATRHPGLISQTIAFSGMYPFGTLDLEKNLAGSKFTLLNGENDPMAPAASVELLVAKLTNSEADVRLEWRAGGHGITPGDLANAQKSL